MKNKMIQPTQKNKFIIQILTALLILLACASLFAAEKYPQPQGAINDFAGVVDQANSAKMEALSRELLQKTGTSIVVATVATLGENEEVSLYVNGLYKAWGIGKKGEDKGILIFLAVKERKIRIETGYGVEGILPDGLIGEILDKYVVPLLKTGNYGQALYNAMYASAAYVAKDARVELSGSPIPLQSKARKEKKGVNVVAVIIFLIIAAMLLGTQSGRSMLPWILLLLLSGGGRGGGGGFGGGFGGFGGGSSGGGGTGRDF